MPSIKQFDCPGCGGTLKYDVDKKEVSCIFCGTVYDSNFLKDFDAELKDAYNGDEEQKENKEHSSHTAEELDGKAIYVCTSCGGEILVRDASSATHCPYCSKNVLIKSRISGTDKPDYVIPFQVSETQAVESFKTFFKKKAFIPNAFKKKNTIQEVSSLYVPYFLFSADTDGTATFSADIVETWSDGEYRYKETSHYRLYREGGIAFDHIPVDATIRVPNDLMECIEPFRLEDHVKFRSGYLAGYEAEKWEVSAAVCQERSNVRMHQGLMNALRGTIGAVYENVVLTGSSSKRFNETYIYALYPIWHLEVSWKDTKYDFAVNGDTGKVAGKYPISKWKFFFMILGILLGAGGIFFCAGFLGNDNDLIMGLACALIGGGIPALVTGLVVGRKLKKRVAYVIGASDYVRPGSFNLYKHSDVFLSKSVSKTKISKD